MFLRFLFNLSILLLSLGQFAALSKSGFTNLYLFDIVLGVFALYGVCYFIFVRRSFVLPSVSVFLIFFSFIALLSLFRVIPLYNNYALFTSLLYLIRWIIYLAFGLVVFNMVHKGYLTKDSITSIFIKSGVFISLVGFIQLLIFPDLSLLDSVYGWDPHKNRLFSTFLDPNFVGAYLTLILAFMFNKYYHQGKDFSIKDFLVTFILVLGLVFTFSRSAWLMFSVVVFIYGLYKSKLMLLTFVIVAFAAYFAVPRIQTRISGITDPADSAHFRLISWGNTMKIAQDNMFLGVGFNTFRFVQKDYGLVTYNEFESHGASGSDSSLLFVLATTGIFGLMFFLGSFLYVLFHTQSLLLKSTILSLLANSLFINSLFYPQILFLWLVVIISYSFFEN